MKLTNVLRKTVLASMTALLASALLFTGCSNGSSSDDYTAEEEAAAAAAAQTAKVENTPATGDIYSGDLIEFPVTISSQNAENTQFFIKYDRSAVGAAEGINFSELNLEVIIGSETLTMPKEIRAFPLDEYGSGFDGAPKDGGKITDANYMKEYKAKVSLNRKVTAGETVKVTLKSTKIGGAVSAVNLGSIAIALIDTDASVAYYKELSSTEYVPLITKKNGAALGAAAGGAGGAGAGGAGGAGAGNGGSGNNGGLTSYDLGLTTLNGWGFYDINNYTATGATVSHTSAPEQNKCCGADITFDTAQKVTFTVKNNKNAAAWLQIAIKNDASGTMAISSAKINGVACADVTWGAATDIPANGTVEYEIMLDNTIGADKFVVCFNSNQDQANNPAEGSITFSNAKLYK